MSSTDKKKGRIKNNVEQVEEFMTEKEIKAEEDELMNEVEAIEEELSEVERLSQEWQQEKDGLLDQLKRKQADIDNLRRINKMEQAEAREYSLHEFLGRLLPVLDNLERGIEAARSANDLPPAYIEGLEMIQRQLMQILEQEEVSVIESEGCAFDPHCHHAVLQAEKEDNKPGVILEELQKGYRHRKRILRPAMVKVAGEE